MAKTKRPKSPHGSMVTTTTTTTRSSARMGPGGRKYITKTVEKSGPKYSFRVESSATTQSALPDEVGFDHKHFGKWPGVLKLLQLVSSVDDTVASDLSHIVNGMPLIIPIIQFQLPSRSLQYYA